MAPRQTLVIGGTGFLGRRIVEEFLRQGDRVAVLTRGQRGPDALPGAEPLHADRHDQAAMRTVLRGRSFDVVVDNIAFNAQDVTQTLETLSASGRVGHYILTSSAAVYANRYTDHPIREQEADLSVRLPENRPDPFHPRLGQAYGNGKRDAEQALQHSSVPWTAIRAPVILGADDRTLRVWWFVQRLLDGGPILFPTWGPGKRFQVAWTHDLARAFVVVANNPKAFGHVYNVAQAEVYTAESWIESAAKYLGATPRYASIPETTLLDVGLPDYTLPIAGRPFGHLLLDISAIRSDLSFVPSPESIWLAETVQGCATNPPSTDSAHYTQRQAEIRAAQSASVPR